jgi:hypothetical protein
MAKLYGLKIDYFRMKNLQCFYCKLNRTFFKRLYSNLCKFYLIFVRIQIQFLPPNFFPATIFVLLLQFQSPYWPIILYNMVNESLPFFVAISTHFYIKGKERSDLKCFLFIPIPTHFTRIKFRNIPSFSSFKYPLIPHSFEWPHYPAQMVKIGSMSIFVFYPFSLIS